MALKLGKPDEHGNYHLEGDDRGPCLLSSRLDDRGRPGDRMRWFVYLGAEAGVVFGPEGRIVRHDRPADALEACQAALDRLRQKPKDCGVK